MVRPETGASGTRAFENETGGQRLTRVLGLGLAQDAVPGAGIALVLSPPLTGQCRITSDLASARPRKGIGQPGSS